MNNTYKTLIGWLLIALAVSYGLSGCSLRTKEVKVLSSKDTIRLQHFDVDDKTTLICDPRGCREAD